MNRHLPPPGTPATDSPLSDRAALELATLPRSIVQQVQATLIKSTLTHSGVIRDRMKSLQIQPRPHDAEEPSVSVYSTDPEIHSRPDCLLNTMMVSAAHQAALDLHNLACTVEPVLPLFDASERFGIAFFAQTCQNAGAGVRLRDTLDLITGEVGARSLSFIPERPWIEIVHQMIAPFASPLNPRELLPVGLLRIRFRGLDWEQVDGLVADALRSLPPAAQQAGRRDVFTLTLSGHG
jgi:hypothetical protein